MHRYSSRLLYSQKRAHIIADTCRSGNNIITYLNVMQINKTDGASLLCVRPNEQTIGRPVSDGRRCTGLCPLGKPIKYLLSGACLKVADR
jgi:hypothetical protein